MAMQFGISHAGIDRGYVRIRRWPFTIGRDPKSDLCLPNSDMISRRHARIVKQDGGCFLLALGRNPTYLNGSPVSLSQPVEIGPGDCIELPDYILDVHDSRRGSSSQSTVHVQVVTGTTIIVRRIASELGLSSWTMDEIFAWLKEARDREVWIRHHQVALCLPSRISEEQLNQRLEQFNALICKLDPSQIKVETIDPHGRRAVS